MTSSGVEVPAVMPATWIPIAYAIAMAVDGVAGVERRGYLRARRRVERGHEPEPGDGEEQTVHRNPLEPGAVRDGILCSLLRPGQPACCVDSG